MKTVMQYGFTSFLIIMTAVFLYVARDWNSTTALFPRVVGFPMLGLTIAILVMDLKNRQRRNRKEKNWEKEEKDKFRALNSRMMKYFGWLIGFIVLIWAIGVDYVMPVYIFSYMKIEGKYGWIKCGIYTVATTTFVVVLFQYVFRVAWPQGALARMLNL